jgi:hypothetical protein
MDPYLEDPDNWRGLHHRLISDADEQLQPQLVPRGYFIDIESRIWLEEPERTIYPDVALLEMRRPPSRTIASASGALVADEPVRLLSQSTEVREDYLQIYETETRRLITGIEFVSPSNKTDHETRDLYLRKRKELWNADVNVVEVDLLRGGKPLVRLPKFVLHSIRLEGYVINLLRVDNLDYEFYPVKLRSPLPRVGVPLKPGEPDVVLDLQTALNKVYDAGVYSMRIDYNREPVPPLDEDAARWADKLLADAGLRRLLEPGGRSNGPDNPTE